MMDEMSIKKHIHWDCLSERYSGFVDLGQNLDDDSLPAASNALVFMLVPLNAHWKVPCAYYLTNGLTGDVLVNLLYNLLTVLPTHNISVVALVCDGCGGNQSMLSNLVGCQ